MAEENTERDLFGHVLAEEAPAYPDAAGFKGKGETGREAAEAMNASLGRYQRIVLDLVEKRAGAGLLPEEACDLTGHPRTTLAPRFSELARKGLIVDSGKRRRNPSSRRNAIVWTLPEYAPAKGAEG